MGNQIRERRHSAGLTQQALAELAGASRSTVKLLEGGYDPPRSAARERIEHALDERVAYKGQQTGSGGVSSAHRGGHSLRTSADPAGCDSPQHERQVVREALS
jgi:transcriptional regulator with XRE-family HTH domain